MLLSTRLRPAEGCDHLRAYLADRFDKVEEDRELAEIAGASCDWDGELDEGRMRAYARLYDKYPDQLTLVFEEFPRHRLGSGERLAVILIQSGVD